MFSVYSILNTVTNKRYIGYTNNLEARWYKHKWCGIKGKGSCVQLYSSMKKHGIDNFQFDIIETNIETKDAALIKEKFYIEKYDTFRSGYNANTGGTGGDMKLYDKWQMAIKRMHENKSCESYATNGMHGKKHSDDSIKKQSISRKQYWDALTLDERLERGKKISGKNNGMYGKVPKNSVQIEFRGIKYKSLSEASKQTGHSVNFLKKHGIILHGKYDMGREVSA